MRRPNNTMKALFAGVAVAGAIVAAAVPASAAGHDRAIAKGHDATPAHSTSAATSTKSGAPSVRHAAAPNQDKANPMSAGYCYAYSDGTGDLCFWYYASYGGSHGGFYYGDANLNDDTFFTTGAGQGSHIGNNSESVWNYDHYLTAWVATSPNYTGSLGYVKPWTGGNFTSTFKNQVESFYWTS